MWWRRERLLSLSFAAALSASLPARADDVVALLELRINGRATERVERFVLRDGVPHATRAEWQAWLGRPIAAPSPTAPIDEGESLSVRRLPGVGAQLDLARQVLDIELPPDPSALTLIGRPVAAAPEATGALAALLNYDLSALRAGGRGYSAGLLEARLVAPQGVLEHVLLANDASAPHVQRLQTTFTHSDPARLRRVRAGDLVNGGLGWTRPVRLLGVQAVTDFALRPGMVTAPTPQLGGQAAVPSTVDVLVNGVRQLSQPVEPGRFEVRQMPVVSGLAEVAVVVRDALGRETVQTLAFYTSNRQLAAGLTAYAFELGRVRRGYAGSANRYEDPAASGTWRHGLSDALTLEAHGEATRGTAVGGGSAMWSVDGIGLLSVALATSAGGGRHGQLASLGAERQTRRFSISLSHTRASEGYRDVATASGDPALLRSTQFGAGVDLGRAGRFGVAAIDRRQGPSAGGFGALHTRLVSATWTRPLAFGAQALVSGYRDLGTGGGSGVALSLSVPFGHAGSAATTIAHDRNGTLASLYAGEAAAATGDVGWRVQSDHALSGQAPARQLAQVDVLTDRARASVELERGGGPHAVRVGLQGALLAFDGGVHAARRVNDSVAVVDVDGQAGVAVYHQNRYVGRTDERGQIVVPDLLSFQPNRVAIDPLDLPLDIDPGQLMRELQPGDRSLVPLRFRFERARAALLELRDAAGQPLPVGARAVLEGSDVASFVVGHDGLAYVRGLSADNRVRVAWGRDAACTVRFGLERLDARTGRIGPLSCE
ncbi:fimbria/pilus outer membrane usher protein [uncultured Methylibium sp.]|uniref:fimbria/pilus outer membrane usher protein n=1 Tax=uncultured Methylibium sp. TaxID=381093 RepID=UPI0025E5E617|nr:fimbria/pilus outer membrane usher protein [uncultured Methylibium sp.]